MRKYNPYRNIFYYYRGPSNSEGELIDRQIEDNATKAFINTLEYSDRTLLLSFLRHVNIRNEHSEFINYDLQVGVDASRPDALIQLGQLNIYLESKIYAPLSEDQIRRHINANELDYLICITPRDHDFDIIQNMRNHKLRFITWKDLYLFFKKQIERHSDDTTQLFINQFLDYLEAIYMAPFDGWTRKDFEAFLNPEDDPKRELRLRIKNQMSKYLIELAKLTVKDKAFGNLQSAVGNIKAESDHCWGVLCAPPLSGKVQIPHFNFVIGSDEFYIGVQIEGKAPSEKMLKFISNNKELFLNILRDLNNFHLIVRKRTNPSGKPRAYKGEEIIKIQLQEDISSSDIDYLIGKMNQFDLFEIHAVKFFRRGDRVLQNASFIEKSFKTMQQLEKYYSFSLGKIHELSAK